MVVNKKKGVKIPSKAVKKSAGAKTKVIRDKKNTTVDIRGAAKRNKTIKPKKSSQLSTPNKNRTSAEKNKRASNNTSPKILKLSLNFLGGMFINFDKSSRGYVYSRGYAYSVL